MRVTVLGLGIMGGGMAANLLRAGHTLTVYNRTASRAGGLVKDGARLAETPRDAAEGADVIISMVGDDAASRAVWLGTAGALAGADGAVLVECSTLSPGWVRELAELAAQRDLAFLDAPVTGSKEAAEGGTLKLLVGGDATALERAREALDAVSSEIVHLGPSGSGATFKLINNLMGCVQIAALAEGLALAERAGLDMQRTVDLLLAGAPASPMVKGKAPRMLARDYDDTHFALRWMHKDATYALDAAAEHGAIMPTLAAARELYQLAHQQGYGEHDFAAVIEPLRGAGTASKT